MKNAIEKLKGHVNIAVEQAAALERDYKHVKASLSEVTLQRDNLITKLREVEKERDSLRKLYGAANRKIEVLLESEQTINELNAQLMKERGDLWAALELQRFNEKIAEQKHAPEPAPELEVRPKLRSIRGLVFPRSLALPLLDGPPPHDPTKVNVARRVVAGVGVRGDLECWVLWHPNADVKGQPKPCWMLLPEAPPGGLFEYLKKIPA